VIVTLKIPADTPEHERVELPEVPKVTLVGLTEQWKSAEGDETVKETVARNAFSAISVMIDVPETPGTRILLAGLAEMIKSGIGTETNTLTNSATLSLVRVTLTR
jgi:hypothetical protein